jgi:hypothetical protein
MSSWGDRATIRELREENARLKVKVDHLLAQIQVLEDKNQDLKLALKEEREYYNP